LFAHAASTPCEVYTAHEEEQHVKGMI
jgi:hypothetical protein